MEPNKKIAVAHSNSRGDKITREEVVQALRDIVNWVRENVPGYTSNSGISELPDGFHPILGLILNFQNGGIQLHETFITLSLGQTLESIELCKVSIYWKSTYTPFARNNDGEFLMVETEGQVVQWNLDIGVVEQISKNLETYLENLRNNMLMRKYQYLDPDCGLIDLV
jgi:hypothetical protein